MSSCITLLCALLLLGLSVEASSGGGGSTTHSYDLSKPLLTQLYNSPVFKAELMKRPLDGLSFMWGPISHSGVRVTLADGSQWLVHKGEDYGNSSDTVVVDARHMSSAWQVFQTCNFHGTKTVADLVAVGGTDYSLVFDNCHMASRRMMTHSVPAVTGSSLQPPTPSGTPSPVISKRPTLSIPSKQPSKASGGSTTHSYDLSKPSLTQLYNSPVFKAELMKRPLDGLSFTLGPISHSGVRVTLADGSQWLVHKGEDYGDSSDNVVVDARHMSSAWQVFQTCNFWGTETVADFMAVGGTDYSLVFDNCRKE